MQFDDNAPVLEIKDLNLAPADEEMPVPAYSVAAR